MPLFDPKARTIAALQKSIDEKNVRINQYFDEIGRLYFGQFKNETEDVSKDINYRCEVIDTLYKEIEEDKIKILFEKGLKVCSSCKKENALEHTFCSVCGAKFENTEDLADSSPNA